MDREEELLMLFTTGTTHITSWQMVYVLVCLMPNLPRPLTVQGAIPPLYHGPGECGVVLHFMLSYHNLKYWYSQK
jgi:hypothetical protein